MAHCIFYRLLLRIDPNSAILNTKEGSLQYVLHSLINKLYPFVNSYGWNNWHYYLYYSIKQKLRRNINMSYNFLQVTKMGSLGINYLCNMYVEMRVIGSNIDLNFCLSTGSFILIWLFNAIKTVRLVRAALYLQNYLVLSFVLLLCGIE